jgi:hypothetical protein
VSATAFCRCVAHGESQRFPPAIDENEEVVVDQWGAVFTAVGISGAVD